MDDMQTAPDAGNGPISGAVAMMVYELFFRNLQFLSLANHGTFDAVCLTDG